MLPAANVLALPHKPLTLALFHSDFSAGAMENWGLMTFRETAVAYNPESQ